MDEFSRSKMPLKKRNIVESDSEDSIGELIVPDCDDTSFMNDDSLSIDADWSIKDDRELIKKVKSLSKEGDKVSYKTRLKQVNWNDVAFKTYSSEDCERRFKNHLKHVRRHRNLNEIVVDIETNVNKCPIKKPLNSYQLFIQDQLTQVKSSGDFSETMKNLATLYKELSNEERSVYEQKAEQLRMEYRQNKLDYDSGKVPKNSNITPMVTAKSKTPFMLYCENNKSDDTDYAKLRENYANLTIDEKYKWVLRAVSDAQDGKGDVSKLLTKDEQRIFKGQKKPTPTAYSLYVKEMYSKIKDQNNDTNSNKSIFAEIASQWKKLKQKKKQVYLDAAALLKQKAEKEQEEFNLRHGMTPQKTKRRKSVFVERTVEDDDDDIEETEPQPKRQKVSKSNTNPPDSDEESDQQKSPQKKTPFFKLPSPKPNGVKSPTKVTQSPVKEITLGQTTIKLSPKTPQLNSISENNESDQGSSQQKKKKKKTKDADLESPKREKSVSVSSENNESEIISSSHAKSDKKKSEEVETTNRKKSNSVSSENNERNDSDDAASTSSGSKNKEKNSEKFDPPIKPASDIISYFAAKYYTEKPHKAKKAWKKLGKKEAKKIKSEYNDAIKYYMSQLQKYLKTLTKEEAVVYINKLKEDEDKEKAATQREDDENSSQEY